MPTETVIAVLGAMLLMILGIIWVVDQIVDWTSQETESSNTYRKKE